MGTIVEALVPADGFVLQRTADTLDGVQFRLERVVAQSEERIMPFVWITEADQEPLEAALADDPTIDGFELVTDLGDRWLYQLDWVDRIETLVGTIVDEDAILLTAKNTEGAWELKFLFLEREAIRSVSEAFDKRGITFDIHRIYDQREGELGTHGLTKKQHRALTLALELGYYEIPRRTDAKTLAGKLDISHQALSEQLRRAHEAVVGDAIGASASILSERPEEAE